MFNNTLLADVWFNVGSEALQAQLQSTAGANESTGHLPQFPFPPGPWHTEIRDKLTLTIYCLMNSKVATITNLALLQL